MKECDGSCCNKKNQMNEVNVKKKNFFFKSCPVLFLIQPMNLSVLFFDYVKLDIINPFPLR